jgi:hypothetical protein
MKMRKPADTSFQGHATVNPLLRLCLPFLLLLGLNGIQKAQAQHHALTNIWSVAPGAPTHTFMINDDRTRGSAYNPVTGHFLVASRSPASPATTNVYILDGTTGSVLGTLPWDASVITSGNFAVNMVGITTDGVIYVGNLTTDAAGATGPFRLYRWANETAQPTLAYSGDPSAGNAVGTNPRRFGDSLALRGTGAGTQILLGTYNQVVGLLTTTDGVTFTATKITTDAAAEETRRCLAWGAGDTFWAKALNGNLRQFSLNIGAQTASAIASIPLYTAPGGTTLTPGGALDVDLTRNLVAILDGNNHKLRVYDISNPAAPVQTDGTKDMPGANANGNFVGSVWLRDGKLFALETANGIRAYTLHEVVFPPSVITQPANAPLWEHATYPFTAGVFGTPPLTYKWQYEGADLPGATSAVCTITNVSPADEGYYRVIVANSSGSVTSSPALLTVRLGNASDQMTNIWDVLPNTRPYLTSGSTAIYYEYGVAINPVTTNVIVVTRNTNPAIGTNMIAVLDIQTGAHKHYIDYSGLPLVGATPMNKVCVADDGVIFVCNYTGDAATTPFTIYGFADDSPMPLKGYLYNTDPGGGVIPSNVGWGANIDARGGGGDTEIIIGAGKWAATPVPANAVAILRYNETVTEFVSTPIAITNLPASNNNFRFGLCWGAGESFWAKGLAGLMHVEFDRTNGVGWVTKTYPTTGARSVPASVTGMAFDAGSGLLAALENVSVAKPVAVEFYDVRDLEAGPFWVDQELFASYNAEIEWQGSVSFEKGYAVALGVNNGLKAFKVNTNFVASLPIILTQPADATWFEGTSATLSVVADSVTSLSYQWYYYGTQAVSGATSATLTLTNIQASQAGEYMVRVFNAGGSRDSLPATLTVIPLYNTAQMTNIWSVTAGSRPYLNTNYNEHGMAFNPVNSNLVVASYVSGNVPSTIVAVMDALTGAHKHTLDVTGVSGGDRAVGKVGVADDGVVYVGNRTQPATSPFVLYRWADDAPTTVPTVAYSGDPAPSLTTEWVGYTMDVRGAGVNTEILLGLNVSNVVCILTTADGVNFTAKEIFVPGAPATFARLGVCWGAGNTFWAKVWRDQGGQMFLVHYDLGAGTGTILRTYTTDQIASTITTIAYNDNLKFLAGIARDDQQNVQIYSVADLDFGPELLDQEVFPTYNPSIEAKGALDFGGNTYLFALDENNGVMAFLLDPSYQPPVTHFKILTAKTSGADIILTWEARNGISYQVQYADALDGTPRTNWTNLGSPVVATGNTASFTNAVSGSKRFYQVIAQ